MTPLSVLGLINVLLDVLTAVCLVGTIHYIRKSARFTRLANYHRARGCLANERMTRAAAERAALLGEPGQVATCEAMAVQFRADAGNFARNSLKRRERSDERVAQLLADIEADQHAPQPSTPGDQS